MTILNPVDIIVDAMTIKKKSKVYCVYYSKSFSDEFEVHAKEVKTSDLFGFIELSEFVYPKKNQIIITPDGNKTEREFKDVRRTFIPIKDIKRIDEYESDASFVPAELKVVHLKQNENKGA